MTINTQKEVKRDIIINHIKKIINHLNQNDTKKHKVYSNTVRLLALTFYSSLTKKCYSKSSNVNMIMRHY